jgi:diguanylate cyclase (GGDEF)-like protein
MEHARFGGQQHRISSQDWKHVLVRGGRVPHLLVTLPVLPALAALAGGWAGLRPQPLIMWPAAAAMVLVAGIGLFYCRALQVSLGRFDDQGAQLQSALEDRDAMQLRLGHQAEHDLLTGLPNRALFSKQMKDALRRQRRNGLKLAVVVVNLDNFRRINESMGHALGDDALAQVAEQLRSRVRATDTVARLGGDEFAILLEGLPDAERAHRVARRIGGPLQVSFVPEGRVFVITASLGLALHHVGERSGDLLQEAGLAMGQAKRAARGTCAPFHASMREGARERLEAEAELRRAIEGEELTLVYQPIVALATGSITGFEALVRWDHPDRGRLAPDRFIPLAEETGLIVPLGWRVLRWACEQGAAWNRTYRRDGLPLTVSVNVSPIQLEDEAFVAEVANVVAECRLDPRCLQLEITENVLVTDPQTALSTLQALRELGVQIAIDDFGTGYSSLGYLEQLPVDVLKVDRRFVASLAERSGAVARAIAQLAASFQMEVVAEGVEQAEQADRLLELGYRHAQGYYFARPVSPQDVDTLLAQGTTLPASPAGPVLGTYPKGNGTLSVAKAV